MTVPIKYKDELIEPGLRLDLIVASTLIVELKAVPAIQPINYAQLMTYLKLSGHRLGLLINFNVEYIRDGLKRITL